jgi:hypothetical protein
MTAAARPGLTIFDDLDDGAAVAVASGALPLSAGGDRFRVSAGPAGHPFCLIR